MGNSRRSRSYGENDENKTKNIQIAEKEINSQ